MPGHNNDADTQRKLEEFRKRKLTALREQSLRSKTPKFIQPKFANIARRPGMRGK